MNPKKSQKEITYETHLINDHMYLGKFYVALKLAENNNIQSINFNNITSIKDLAKKAINETLDSKRYEESLQILLKYFPKEEIKKDYLINIPILRLTERLVNQYEDVSEKFREIYNESEYKVKPFRKQKEELEDQLNKIFLNYVSEKVPLLSRIRIQYNFILLENKTNSWHQDYQLQVDGMEKFIETIDNTPNFQPLENQEMLDLLLDNIQEEFDIDLYLEL